jgi:hypothetical protein
LSSSNLSNSIIYKIDDKNFGINITTDLRREELKSIRCSADDIWLEFTRNHNLGVRVVYPENLYLLPHEIELALLRCDFEPALSADVIEEISGHVRDNIEEIIEGIDRLNDNGH